MESFEPVLEDTMFINVHGPILLARSYNVKGKDHYAVAVLLQGHMIVGHAHILKATALRSFSVGDGHVHLSGRALFTFLMYFNKAISSKGYSIHTSKNN